MTELDDGAKIGAAEAATYESNLLGAAAFIHSCITADADVNSVISSFGMCLSSSILLPITIIINNG